MIETVVGGFLTAILTGVEGPPGRFELKAPSPTDLEMLESLFRRPSR